MRFDIALLYWGLRLAGLLPLRVLHAMGAGGGLVLSWFPVRIARHLAINLKLVRPELADAERGLLAREVLQHGGRAVAELARVWGAKPETALGLVREVRGLDLFESALASERGLIIAAPHLGCWELLNHWLCSRTAMTILYRPPRMAALEPLLRRARGALGPTQVRADGSGVRTLFRCLAEGGTVGVLPDQEPRSGEGRFAAFFRVEALTMVLLPRLARRTGATVLFAFAERLPNGQGFCLHFSAAPQDIASSDTDLACRALNQGVENCVEQAFTQYQWHYKRFRQRPDGGSNPYARDAH